MDRREHDVFQVFERHDLAPSPDVSYAGFAHDLSLSVSQVTNYLHAARRRFRELALGICKTSATRPTNSASKPGSCLASRWIGDGRAAPADDLDQRLRQEAKVLARLEHPGIVPVHDAGLLDDGRWFYVMKLVRGETLTDHAASLEHEAARLVVFERVAETVAFARAAGIVHRDLKPSNVMVGQFGEVLVLDWGVARVLARMDRDGGPAARAPDHQPDGAGDGTSGGTRMGTAGFMAPEQAQGDSSNDLARYRQGAAVSAYRDTAFERAAAF